MYLHFSRTWCFLCLAATFTLKNLHSPLRSRRLFIWNKVLGWPYFCFTLESIARTPDIYVLTLPHGVSHFLFYTDTGLLFVIHENTNYKWTWSHFYTWLCGKFSSNFTNTRLSMNKIFLLYVCKIDFYSLSFYWKYSILVTRCLLQQSIFVSLKYYGFMDFTNT